METKKGTPRTVVLPALLQVVKVEVKPHQRLRLPPLVVKVVVMPLLEHQLLHQPLLLRPPVVTQHPLLQLRQARSTGRDQAWLGASGW